MNNLHQQRHRNCGPVAIGLVVLACMPLHAIAESFTPTDEATLRASLATAASNGDSDTIDLNGATITLKNGPLTYVFSGTGEPQLTIQNGTLLAGPDSNILQIKGFASSPDSVVISNMTFANGDRKNDSDDDAPGRGQGGAIFSTLPLVIMGSTFSDNSADISGGAVYSQRTIQVSNSFFERNSAADAGGAINGLSSVAIDVSLFSDNSSNRGGAVFTGFSSSLAIAGSTFVDNSSSSLGGGVFSAGGSPVSISESTFIRNEARTGGGALYFQSLAEAAQISRVTMWDNSAVGSTGSAIRNFASSVNLVNTFIGSNVDDDSMNCQRQDNGLIIADFLAVGSLSTDISCGSPSDSGATGTEREVFASFFGSQALLTDEGFAVGSGRSQGLPVLIPAENGPLDDVSGDVCVGLDQRGNAVTDGRCDIGSVELLPTEQDTDTDGTNDEQDNCPLLANDQEANVDGDPFGDACDDDIDGDGTLNGDDAFPRDVDEDTDTDRDGFGDRGDNCPLVSNPLQENSNSNPAGDACEVEPAPLCFGEEATVYVNSDNMIVGGQLAGRIFAGTLRGTTQDDVIVGTSGDDRILGLAGNDLICGLAGNDFAAGASGVDRLFGGTGNDELRGGTGNDELFGGSGNDVLRGSSGNDQISGEAGDDEIHGNVGNDQLDGGAGNDTLFGGQQDDQLLGGEGDDELFGHAGVDMLDGGAGNDVGRGGPAADTCVNVEQSSSCVAQ